MSAEATAAPLAIGKGRDTDRFIGRLFLFYLLFSLAIGFTMLAALLVKVLIDGIPSLSWQLLSAGPSIDPAKAGARPAILASLYLGALLIAFTVPIGVGTAVYLEEYARKDRWYNRLLELNIQNLAGVPSIVYGILGLAFLVRGIGLGRVLLAGALILTLLVLPTVIVASREAIRAVPDSIRQGAFALGATKWQVVWKQVLPASIPGIATGSILALSRAASARRRRCCSSAPSPSSASTRRCWAPSRRCRSRSSSGSPAHRTSSRRSLQPRSSSSSSCSLA